MEIGPRMKSERERLGLSQTALADAIGSSKRSVINWEGGTASPPADAIGRMAIAGVDVLYVITGERGTGVSEVELLRPDERVLIDAYQRCNHEAQRNLIQTAALLSAGLAAGAEPAPASPPAPSKQVNKAAGSVMVGVQTGGTNTTTNTTTKGKKK